ncbi:MAG: phenylalanine--tRNA ligase subunit alpha, partial [Phascolarctobacterium sp.]|nr:phenylalanine--tRNA ligase subunit alpha [Candidatus Phascolarctobacterium caballi]
MKEELEALKKQALEELAKVDSLDILKDLKVKYLGKKGPMTEILRGMGKLAAEERPKIGQIVNDIKTELQRVVEEKSKLLEQKALEFKLAN